MFKPVTRTLAFFVKDTLSVFRQPRLILSLIIGPFLILLFFGLGYTGTRSTVEAIMVAPKDSGLSTNPADYKDLLAPGFHLAAVTEDEAWARAQLQARKVGVVVIWPGAINPYLASGNPAPLRILFDEVNPVQIQWTDFAAYVQTNELNKRILMAAIDQTRARTLPPGGRQDMLTQQLDQVNSDLDRNDRASARLHIQDSLANVHALQQEGALLGVVGSVAGAVSSGQAAVTAPVTSFSTLDRLEKDLTQLDQALSSSNGNPSVARADLQQVRQELNGNLIDPARIPANVLVSPVTVEKQNLAPFKPTAISFFGPAAMALMLQHIAITLMALSLVRERSLGALELFQVAPVRPIEVLVGKLMSYSFIVTGVGAALFLLLTLALGVPLLGSSATFVAIIGTLILVSLSIGMIISLASKTDSQAVQLTMLVLLASVFFSGFFVSLDSLMPWVRGISYAMPATYAILALQDVMLRGQTPETWQLLFPGLGALALFVIAARWFGKRLSSS